MDSLAPIDLASDGLPIRFPLVHDPVCDAFYSTSIPREIPFELEVDCSMIRGFLCDELVRLVRADRDTECDEAMFDLVIGLIDHPIVVIWITVSGVPEDHGSSHARWYGARIDPTMGVLCERRQWRSAA